MSVKQAWLVHARGKWGGSRNITVHATTESKARSEARALLRSDETITRVTKETS